MRLFVLQISVAVLIFSAACAIRPQSNSLHPRSLEHAAREWERALAERDAERVASFYDQEVVALYPHPRPTIGWEANRDAWRKVFRSPTRAHPVRIDEVVTADADDLGYTFGTWWSFDPASNHDSGGRFLAVWRRIGGEWRITRLSANKHDDVRSDGAPRP